MDHRTERGSEIIAWRVEALHTFIERSGGFVTSAIPGAFFSHNDQWYSSAVFNKNGYLENMVTFINGTLIGVARPDSAYFMQLVLYNGEKRKHTIKFQAVTTLNGHFFSMGQKWVKFTTCTYMLRRV